MDAQKAGAGQVVLVVEDEPMQRMMMADMLYDAGFWSVEAGDAHQALHLLESRSDIRIVFADIGLPYGFDGLELAEIVRKRLARHRDRADVRIDRRRRRTTA
jgi:CheY-like chemotaxis protein